MVDKHALIPHCVIVLLYTHKVYTLEALYSGGTIVKRYYSEVAVQLTYGKNLLRSEDE